MTHWISAHLGTGAFGVDLLAADTVPIDVRFLVDRAGNRQDIVARIIEEALQALQAGKRVVVCCDHGISRSNAVAAGVLARWEAIPLADAVRRVLFATDGGELRIDVLDAVRAAVDKADGRAHSPCWLITGGHGALGTALVAAAPMNTKLLRPTHRELDLLHGAALLDLFVRENGVVGIVHLASPHVGNTNSSVGDALVMIRNVLDVCVSNRIPAFVPSRWEVFGGYKGQILHAIEDTTLRPEGVLGDAKFLAEALIEQYARRRGVSIAVLRSGLVYGDGAAPNFLKYFVERARTDSPIATHLFANGSPMLDMVTTRDWTRAAWGLLESRAAGVFHCGGGELIETREIARIVVERLGSDSAIKTIEIEEQSANVRLESGKLMSLTGWIPTDVPRAGLAAFANSMARSPNHESVRSD